jgi:class 3 adenylate cyclase/tetratricopeptide (TPR) repeat protein
MVVGANDIGAWLNALGLGQYAPAFCENAVDLETLPQLNDADLKELGVAALGHRKKILAAIVAMAPQAIAASGVQRADAAVERAPQSYTPQHLAERIRRERRLLEGERKLLTVFFADIKGSMELLASLDAETARQVLDSAVEVMMRAVHRYEGTVNKILGDGIMAVFGAPIAHEDHATRACYAALAVHENMRRLADQMRATIGVEPAVRIGLHSGEVVVGSIGNDLSVEYDAVGPTVHLAARMEQLARPGTTRLTAATAHLVEGFCLLTPLGPVPVKGLAEPADVFELTGATKVRGRLQAMIARGFTKFVGRSAEIDMLTKALKTAGAGAGQLVGVVGEPGVGKSRLYHEFVSSAATDGWLKMVSLSVSHGKATAYLPVIDVLRDYLDVAPGDDPRRTRERVLGRIIALDEELRSAATPILALFDVPVDDDAWNASEPMRRRALTIEAVTALIAREAEERPVLLIFEDLHWADNESLAVLDALVDRLSHARILMLVNFRPEFAERWSSRSNYTRIRLLPLPPQGAEELLTSLLGDSQELTALKRSLIERATGNPFFLEECVRTLVEQGALVGEKGRRRLAHAAAANLLPASVQAVLASRIDRLDVEVKRVLQTASVIGKDFGFRLLLGIVDLPEDVLEASLSILRTNEFVYETQLFPESEYTFKHALTHDVALSGLLFARRRELHARIIEAIERLYPNRLVEHVDGLAHHAMRGEVWDKAFHYGRQAGERAAARSAHRDAVVHFEQALAALGHLPTGQERDATEIDLRLRLRDELFVLGAEPDVLAPHVDAALRLARAMGDTPRLSRALLQVGTIDWLKGRHREALENFRGSLSIAESLGDEMLAALGRYRCGISLVFLGDMQAAEAILGASIRQLDTEQGRRAFYFGGSPFSFASTFRAIALAELGRFDEAEEISRRGLANATALNHAYTIMVACFGLAHAYIRRGNVQPAIEVLTIAEEQTAMHGASAAAYWTITRVAHAAAIVGDADRARKAIQALQDSVSKGTVLHDALNLVFVASAARHLGDTKTARRYTDQVIERAREQHEENSLAHGLLLRTLLDRDEGKIDDAFAALDEAEAIAARRGYRPLAAECALTRAEITLKAKGAMSASPLFATAAETARGLGMEALARQAEAANGTASSGARARSG